ncbi:hypothetical protein ACFVZZ_17295 [Streptomyces chartreusis]|uniref:hypothetical protein n=1 Tax=Streptomyces chartreusis TaxID=1969 RepID=UPI0036DF8857
MELFSTTVGSSTTTSAAVSGSRPVGYRSLVIRYTYQPSSTSSAIGISFTATSEGIFSHTVVASR